MFKKLVTMLIALAMILSVSACGEDNSVFEEIEEIKTSYSFPDADSSSKTLDTVYDSIEPQQRALLEAYIKNISLTDIKKFENKVEKSNRNELITALNEKRMELDSAAEKLFFENMNKVMSDVNDCKYKDEYIEQRRMEVRGFVYEYSLILNIENEEPSDIDKMIQNHATWTNRFATTMIREHSDEIINKAIMVIEENANADESFGAYIKLNNETVRAINYLFRGVGENDEFRQRINDSNYKLLEKMISASPDITTEDKESMLEQLRENQRLSDRSNQE